MDWITVADSVVESFDQQTCTTLTPAEASSLTVIGVTSTVR